MNNPLDAITKAADGLLLQSETDAPLVPYFPDAAWISFEFGAALSGAVRVNFDKYFDDKMIPEGWENADEIAICERWRVLYDALRANLTHCSVWKRDGFVYIMGCAPDGYAAGLKSKAVET